MANERVAGRKRGWQHGQKLKWKEANSAAVDIIFSIKSHYVSDDSKILAISGILQQKVKREQYQRTREKKMYTKKQIWYRWQQQFEEKNSQNTTIKNDKWIMCDKCENDIQNGRKKLWESKIDVMVVKVVGWSSFAPLFTTACRPGNRVSFATSNSA